MTQQTFDPETANFDDLAAAANAELTSGVQDLDPDTQTAGDEQAEEVVYERVIDLGDGSGVQVFRGATPEELIERLAEAQTHATRKIRELNAARQPQTQAPTEPAVNPDEEFVISQEFLQSPTKAFAKLFQRTTGMTIAEFNEERKKVSAITKDQADFNTGREFVQSTPDYYNSDANNARLMKWLKIEGLDATIENLAKGFKDLNESGLLESRPESNQDAATTRQSAPQPRIAEPAPRIVGQRRAASGLSQRGSREVVRSQGPTEDELYKMSYEQLAALAQEESRRQ